MQLTLNFVLLTVALAYGGATVSALPAGGVSLAARSEYEGLLEARDVELFVRDPPRPADDAGASKPKPKPPQYGMGKVDPRLVTWKPTPKSVSADDAGASKPKPPKYGMGKVDPQLVTWRPTPKSQSASLAKTTARPL